MGCVADVHVEDLNHLATLMLPLVHGFGDEHHNFVRGVRGSHHVLLTLGESSYDPNPNAGVRWVAGERHRRDCDASPRMARAPDRRPGHMPRPLPVSRARRRTRRARR